jgi:hypothetical protein
MVSRLNFPTQDEERKAEAVAKAQQERLETERLAAVKTKQERQQAATKAKQERLEAEATAKAEQERLETEAAATAEQERLAAVEAQQNSSAYINRRDTEERTRHPYGVAAPWKLYLTVESDLASLPISVLSATPIGTVYYHNTITEQSQWDVPAEVQLYQRQRLEAVQAAKAKQERLEAAAKAEQERLNAEAAKAEKDRLETERIAAVAAEQARLDEAAAKAQRELEAATAAKAEQKRMAAIRHERLELTAAAKAEQTRRAAILAERNTSAYMIRRDAEERTRHPYGVVAPWTLHLTVESDTASAFTATPIGTTFYCNTVTEQTQPMVPAEVLAHEQAASTFWHQQAAQAEQQRRQHVQRLQIEQAVQAEEVAFAAAAVENASHLNVIAERNTLEYQQQRDAEKHSRHPYGLLPPWDMYLTVASDMTTGCPAPIGTVYYYNTATTRVEWDVPVEVRRADYEARTQLIEAARAERNSTEYRRQRDIEQRTRHPHGVSAPWKLCLTVKSDWIHLLHRDSRPIGTVYYYNSSNTVTSWDVPAEVGHLNRYYNTRLIAKATEDEVVKDKPGRAEQQHDEPAPLAEREHLEAPRVVPQMQTAAELADQAFALQLQREEEDTLARETEELAQWARLQAFLALPTSTRRIGEDVTTGKHTESAIQQHHTHRKIGEQVSLPTVSAAASETTAPATASPGPSAEDQFLGQQIRENFVGFGTYTGIVTRKSVDGGYVIRYDDGDVQTRTERQVRALLQQVDEQCRMDSNQQECQEKTSALDDTVSSRSEALNSSYIGVTWSRDRKKWEARIQRAGAPAQHLGRFSTEEEAARAFDAAARRLRGDAAHGGRSCPSARQFR